MASGWFILDKMPKIEKKYSRDWEKKIKSFCYLDQDCKKWFRGYTISTVAAPCLQTVSE